MKKLMNPETPEKKLPQKFSYQAWNLTKMKYDFTLCEKKIFLKVIEACQSYINQDMLGKNISIEMVKEIDGATPQIEIPIKEIVDTKTRNYKWVVEGLHSLAQKGFGLPKDGGWDFREIFLFRKIEASEKNGKIRVTLNMDFWEAFYDLRVFKIIDTKLESRFKLVSTMRIYELLVGNTSNVTYEIENLKKLFCNEDRYKNNSHFIRWIIEPARNEMMETENCPFYFDYDVIKVGRKLAKLTFVVKNKIVEEKKRSHIEEAKHIDLSDKVLTLMRKSFPDVIIRDDMQVRLCLAQKYLGEDGLMKLIRTVCQRCKKMRDEEKLSGSELAYLMGSLKNVIEKGESESNSKLMKSSPMVEDANIIEESRQNDGYLYMTQDEIKKKASLAGFEFEAFIKEIFAEKVDDNTYRVKI